jgi:hypothetical protein
LELYYQIGVICLSKLKSDSKPEFCVIPELFTSYSLGDNIIDNIEFYQAILEKEL